MNGLIIKPSMFWLFLTVYSNIWWLDRTSQGAKKIRLNVALMVSCCCQHALASPYVIYIILSLVSSCHLSYRILPNFLWFSKHSLAFAFRGKNFQWFGEGWRHFLGEEKVLWLVSFVCTMPSNKSGIFSIWYAICALHIVAFSCCVQYFCN